ncbi:MAG: hypothetical protein U9Q74_02600 [Gemmatimonadota bacterium]|nr:hypothetical protein [Gemmatimonadota bacterium]
MQVWMKERVSVGMAREMGLWATVLMLLGQHFFEGGLRDVHVASSVGAGLGIWAAFRFLIRPPKART